jgi:hypothetical protein
MYSVCGEKALKTLLAIEAGDSIVGVARKVDENRETIRRTVDTLEEEGFVAYEDGLHVVDASVREAGLAFLATAAGVSQPSISEAYVLPHFASMDFAFTSIDAVCVWTKGGHQVARDPDDYPIFIAVEISVEAELVDGRPVIPLDETLKFAREHCAAFQSALDMLDRMYDEVETDADYRLGPA